MKQILYDTLEGCPVIAAVKNREGLENSIASDCAVVFLLFGDICSIGELVEKVKRAGKMAIVHVDLIGGLASKEIAVDFIKRNTKADGIITTKPLLIKRAKELNLFSVLRFFVLDSIALENIEKQEKAVQPDIMEILPGVMPKIIRQICSRATVPVIAGGLISEKEDVIAALASGAVSISTTDERVWFV